MFKVRDLLGYALDIVCRVTCHRWCHVIGKWSCDLLDEPLNQRIKEHY